MRRLLLATAVAVALILSAGCKTHAARIDVGLDVNWDTWPCTPSPYNDKGIAK